MSERARAIVEPCWRELRLAGEPEVWLAQCGLPLAEALARRVVRGGDVRVVGVAGAQGTGKSSACRLLVPLLEQVHGLDVLVLGLDDFYLTRAAREQLGREVHPLLVTRGVPGTHELPLLAGCLQGLRARGSVDLPRFSKALDDRLSETTRVSGRYDLVLLEGWCVGARAQSDEELAPPCNALEAYEDVNGRFRGYVNAQLAGGYRLLFEGLDALVFFAAPDMESVLGFRREQEESLRRAAAVCGMSDVELARFVAHFERITVDMLRRAPGYADVLVRLDGARRVTSFVDRVLR